MLRDLPILPRSAVFAHVMRSKQSTFQLSSDLHGTWRKGSSERDDGR